MWAAAELISEDILLFRDVFSPDAWCTDDDISSAYEILNLKRIKEILSIPKEQ